MRRPKRKVHVMNRYEQQTVKERVASALTVVTLLILTIALVLLNVG